MLSLDIEILGPAFIAGLLVLSTHVPLGRVVLERGIIFIDLAVAQIAGLGVILAATLGFHTDGWEVQLFAVGSALLGAWALSLMERRSPHTQEALIGVVFVLAATGSIMLLAGSPQGSERLKDLLVGQILWLTWPQLLPFLGVTLAVLFMWHGFPAHRRKSFYLLFALAVTSSVQLVGIYLVFASLIIPALGSRQLSGRAAWVRAFGIGVIGYALGLALSSLFDLPSGAVIVWVLALSALFAVLTLRPPVKQTG